MKLERSQRVAEALRNREPIVALESTVITHGLPHPQNLEVARALESEVGRHGAVPATIAVLNGEIRVGLDEQELEQLASAHGSVKISRRDLAIAVAQQQSGGTTVAGTAMIACQAGIRLFATGGIGGVHRQAETTFDLSADLAELTRTPMAIVCAGAKLILDIPKTLEVLETLGIPVVGYRTDAFPGFWCRSSGAKVTVRMDSVEQIAGFLRIKWSDGELVDEGAVIIANPVDLDQALPREEMEHHIGRALSEANRRGVSGKEVTPYLLARMSALTEGATVLSNRTLLLGNARLAAQLAVRYAN